MLFSSKILLYLKRNTLEVYRPGTEGILARLEFPPDTTRDEEIINQPKFEEVIATFLNKLAIKEREAIVILSDELIFQKTIPVSDETTEANLAQQFAEEIPFDKQEIAQKWVKTKNGVNLFATNKNLFLALAGVVAKMGKNVEAVIPATMFGITQSAAALSKDDLKKITANSSLLTAANFLTSLPIPPEVALPATQGQTQQTTTDKSSSSSSFLILVGITIIIIGAAAAFFLYKKPNLKNINLNFKLPTLSLFAKKASPQITASPSPDQSPSPSPQQEVAKDQLTVQILNGTGKESQASLVKGSLENIGFTNIQTGNAASQDHDATSVDFAGKVPTQTRQEIVSDLEKLFVEIKMNVADSQEFDVTITTGKQK